MPRTLAKLGKQIRVLRKERGLTQESAAEAARLDPKHWQEIEAGRINVTVATLIAVSRALRVPISGLFNGM